MWIYLSLSLYFNIAVVDNMGWVTFAHFDDGILYAHQIKLIDVSVWVVTTEPIQPDVLC